MNDASPCNDPGKEELEALRRSIDGVDDRILALIHQRLLLAKRIGDIKRESRSACPRLDRESLILNRLCAQSTGLLNPKHVVAIFTDIISACREMQLPQRIVYLGPEATFTHIAAMNHFGRSASFVPQTSIQDVFFDVEKGLSQYGVVPVENSIEGSVNYTLDLFFESDLKICAENYMTISHDLLSQSGDIEDIRIVYSHPQPFGQCRKWLRKNLPHVPLEECSSTSAAAKKAAEMDNAAAIAGAEAARIYNLQVVASRIEDFVKNTTRFLIIGKENPCRTGRDKTSIMFSAPHIPGALYKVLQPIAEAGINMMKLESRPSKHKNWSYFFFVDLEGHMEDRDVRETVTRMQQICLFLKILGSYPQAVLTDNG
ncbi:MAG: prephenate dehydratase [Thermodesulfobacteriota bacterium]